MSTESQPADGDRARTVQGERSRVALLNAAIDLISERGYAGTSVGDVCKRAGVAKTALYWHFENKEAVVNALYQRYESGLDISGEWAFANLDNPGFTAYWQRQGETYPEAFRRVVEAALTTTPRST